MERAESSATGLGSSVTGCAVVVAIVAVGALFREAPNRFGLLRRLVTAATVVASVVGAAVVVVVVVERGLLLPKRRLVVGRRLDEPELERTGEL